MLPFFSRGRSRILTKVLLGTSILVAASVLSLSWFFLLRHKAAFQEQFRLRAESLATSLAGQGQFALLVENRAELERMARIAVAGDGDVMYVIVEDAAGHYLAGAERPPISRQMLPAGAPDVSVATVRRVGVGPGGSLCMEAAVPVVPQAEGGIFGLRSTQPELLGRIRVALSLRSQDALFLATLRQVSAIALLILLLACTISYFQIRRLLRPLVELAHAAKLVGQGDCERSPAVKTTDDEIGDLVDSFNLMVGQVADRTRELSEQVNAKELARAELAEAQQRLIDLSRRSGMAEVATNVLHNVGNVLNSVNVSATILAGRIKESRVDKLAALVAMLNQHFDGLEEFLRRDPRGQRVLPYLEKLGLHFQQERQAMLKEIEHLTGHIGHIKQIVATQQNYAKVSGLIEDFSLRDLVEDALQILQPGFERHQIVLLRDFEETPRLVSDKHLVLQILLNLLRNAKQAIADAGKPERLIRVRIRPREGDRVRLEVKDSGVGLPPEHLTRIFAHGFTTKPDGHGFGLHSGALAARQLGGSLWAESEGSGLGATFTLELPRAAADSKESDPHETAVLS